MERFIEARHKEKRVRVEANGANTDDIAMVNLGSKSDLWQTR
jgi:hypothetical protein